jgi:UDP-N-acetylmuramyl pentapeptide synthase
MGGDHEAATAAEAVDLVRGLIRTGDTVLVKGSRGVGLEAVAEAL